MSAEISKDFIFNYLAGKSSALQKQMIDEWVKSPANEELFYKWLVEYEYQQPQYLIELPEALSRFHAFADNHDQNPDLILTPATRKVLPSYKLGGWMMAASVVLGLLIGSWVFLDKILYKTYRTAFGETQALVLDDSTVVTLNANSSLQVPRFGFGTQTREVLLKGEADFAVSHTATNQKFIVKADKEFEVVVWGTEFTVYTRQQRAKVVLNKGKVELRYREGKDQKQVMLKPGDLVTLDQRNQLKHEVISNPETYTAWKDERYVFDDTSLQEFARIFEENYGIRLVIQDDSLAKRTLEGSFRADNAEELLAIVAEIFSLKIVRKDNTIVLTENL
ncbi:FecR family protein [Telluribacter sp.]|jgi:ferric-dicitrate binding protein FerR (iron transport regulator)|uniref:FecR family protein n=1 Tax=Telluribacter sp. TaxID=1978767 RepID=UPI002E0E25A9|nr:FecR domain-containing protein [Telluribacter sp.]